MLIECIENICMPNEIDNIDNIWNAHETERTKEGSYERFGKLKRVVQGKEVRLIEIY